MSSARPVVKFALAIVLWSLVGIHGSAQVREERMSNATSQQVAALLKSDPSLSTGFETAARAKVQFVRPVPGGVEARFESGRTSGTLTVTGPPETIFMKSWLGGIVDALAARLGAIAPVKCSVTVITVITTQKDGSKSINMETTVNCSPA